MPGRSTIALLSGLSLATAITGCIDSSDSNGTSGDETTQTLTGTAAQGAPLKNTQITVRCVNDDSDPTLTTVTNESGAFETENIPEESFPCGLKADDPDSDDAYYSLAQEPGQANVTPYTDMVVAVGASKDPAQWFNNLKNDGFILDESRINNAVTVLNEGLSGLGLPVDDTNPMRAEFEIGDDYDLSMDRFIAGVANADNIDRYSDIRTLLKDGNTDLEELIGSVPESAPDEGTESPGYAQCWNEDLYTPGHKSVQEVEVFREGESYYTAEKTHTVEDRPGSEVAVIQEYEPDDPEITGSKATTIYDVDVDTPKVWAKKSTTNGTSTTFDPARVTDYSLEAGESYQNNYEVIPDDDSRPTNTIESTRTFVRVETINLPNIGAVEACRVEGTEADELSETTVNVVRWYDIDTGLLLRNQIDGETSQEVIGGSR